MRIAKTNLKKQSQFIKGQNNATSLQVMIYGNLGGWRLRKNKAKQSQTKPTTIAGSDAKWIPAFAGMTNIESQRKDEEKEFEKTKPIYRGSK